MTPYLYNLAHFVDRKVIEPPFLIQTIIGVLGGISVDWEKLAFMKVTADRLFGDAAEWLALAAGRSQTPFVTQDAARNWRLRVGLEDGPFIERSKLSTANAGQVRKIRTIVEDLDLQIATPTEARAMLALKGRELGSSERRTPCRKIFQPPPHLNVFCATVCLTRRAGSGCAAFANC